METDLIKEGSIEATQNDLQSESKQEPAFFTAIEARVIASLMEKHLTTPNNYPLTMNSLANACNQKSNREPVMNLTEGEIGHTINELKERKLAGLEYGDRASKITHRVCTELNLDRKQQAVLTVLMLRKPQTLNDIKTRTARMVDFSDTQDLHDTINSLINREKPLATLIPKGAGRREDRYAHTLCGTVEMEESHKEVAPLPAKSPTTSFDEDRLKALEDRVARLEAKLLETHLYLETDT